MKQEKRELFTIGFAGKGAREFFGLLVSHGVERVIDIRLNNLSQLAGFTKKEDLCYFLEALAGIDYVHAKELAPTEELLKAMRDKELSWEDFEGRFMDLLAQRRPVERLAEGELARACLLCSEAAPERCHRSLVARYFAEIYPGLEIVHL
jgi:uncharacterized protein (DUF488 family)